MLRGLLALALFLVRPARSDVGAWHALDVPRWSATAATIDKARHQIVAFGLEDVAGEVYTALLDAPDHWTRKDIAGPGPLIPDLSGSISVPEDGTFYVCGSAAAGCWCFETTVDRWRRVGNGLDRVGVAMAFDRSRHRLVAFAGQAYGGRVTYPTMDVLTMPADSAGVWTPLVVQGQPPLGRVYASAVYDDQHDRLLVYGGRQKNGIYVDETWELSFATDPPTWRFLTPLAAVPPGRQMACLAMDREHLQMLMYGGLAGSTFNDVWALATDSLHATWAQITTPATPFAIAQAGTVMDSAGGRFFVVGDGSLSHGRDLQMLATRGTRDWSRPIMDPAGPPQGVVAAALLDESRDRIVVIMEPLASLLGSEIWSRARLAEGGWTHLGTLGVGLYAGNDQILVDPLRDRLVVLRGATDSVSVSTAPLASPLALTPLAPSGSAPGKRLGFSAGLDAARDRVLVFGGVEFDSLQHVVAPNVYALALGASPAWSLLAVAGPPALVIDRQWIVMDPLHDQMLTLSPTLLQTLALGTPSWTSRTLSLNLPGYFDRQPVLDGPRSRVLWSMRDREAYQLDALPLGASQWGVAATTQLPPAADLGHALVADTSADRLWDVSSHGAWVLNYGATSSFQIQIVEQRLDGTLLHLRWRSPDRSVTRPQFQERLDGSPWSDGVPLGATDVTDFVFPWQIDSPGLYEFRLAVAGGSGMQYLGATSFRANAAPPFDPHAAFLRAHHNPTDRALTMDVWDPVGDAQLQDRLELYDIAGRRIATRALPQTSGWQSIDMGAGLHLRPGVYLVRLGLYGRRNIDTRVVVL